MLAFLPPIGRAPSPDDPNLEPESQSRTTAGIVLAIILVIMGIVLPPALRLHSTAAASFDLSAIAP